MLTGRSWLRRRSLVHLSDQPNDPEDFFRSVNFLGFMRHRTTLTEMRLMSSWLQRLLSKTTNKCGTIVSVVVVSASTPTVPEGYIRSVKQLMWNSTGSVAAKLLPNKMKMLFVFLEDRTFFYTISVTFHAFDTFMQRSECLPSETCWKCVPVPHI